MPSLYVETKKHEVDPVKRGHDSEIVKVDGKQVRVEIVRELSYDPTLFLVRAEDQVLRISVQEGESLGEYTVQLNGKRLAVKTEDESVHEGRTELATGPVLITAPMAGRIGSVKANVGTTTEKGEPLVVLEAMKMENEIACPRKARIEEVYVKPGDLVKAGDRLCLIQ